MGAKKVKKSFEGTTIDAEEIRQFDALGTKWWDIDGPMKPLHMLNPTRLDYIRGQILSRYDLPDTVNALKGLSIADIGCGGGIVTEPLCRMGAKVTGVDAGNENINIARAHAKDQGLNIDYICTSVEAMAAQGKQFDVVTALEIVEHVADVPLFLAACCKIVKKDGLLILSTLNRTPKSFALGIVAAEYVLGWVPKGTHDWKKFLKPSELARPLAAHGFDVCDISGLFYNPVSRKFSINPKDLDVNYLLTARAK